MKIRPASIETDLPRIVEIINPYESKPVTVEQMRAYFEYTPPGRVQLRLAGVDENDTAIGYGGCIHEASSPDGHFVTWVIVDPAHRRQGAGAALWEACLDFLQEHGATRLTSDVLDYDPVGLAFAERCGFSVDRHSFGSSLDLASFDEAPYLPGIAALAAQGLRFCALAEFPDEPATLRQLYDLNAATVLDIPGNDSLPWNFQSFERFVVGAPWFNRAGQLLAVDGEAWVGLGAVSLSPETQSAYNEFTGVLRTHRGRKIAQALKVLAARYARQHGAREIRTNNDSLNAPILAINRKLGYQPQPGKYILVRWLSGIEQA